ncbi:Nif3-like dinuclear metal center hexameric protein [Desulfovibrio sp. OttesenSCG-928-G15]|nr:Nif3-like dinuclear metal center hexameric protein [Desulfovibrio sp. OttesenSCG-928-G15]
MKAAEIINIIEKIAPLGAQAPWDASGVQVASFKEECVHLAVMLDPTFSSVENAVAAGADFILSHHPFSMQPRFPNRADEYLAVLSRLISRNIWLYSAHTSLDASPEGPVRWLAGELQLHNLSLLEPTASPEGGAASDAGGAQGHGFGFVGDLPGALSYEEFCSRLSACLGREEWQACGERPAHVHRVACCPGSGGSMFKEARAAGADVYITGDVKYHTALDAATAGIRILDVGHFILEEEMMRRLALHLHEVLPIPVTFVPGVDPLGGEHVRDCCGVASGVPAEEE